jgi:hypothetical protein
MVQKDHPSYLSSYQIAELDHYLATFKETLARIQLIRDLPSGSVMYYIGKNKELHGFSCKKIKDIEIDVLVNINGQRRRLPTVQIITADIYNAIKSQALLLGEQWPPTPF